MRFSFAHDIVTYLFAGLGLTALYLGGTFSPTFAVILAAIVVGSAFLHGDRIASKAYANLITAAVVGLLAVQTLRAIFLEPFFPMAIEFAALLQVSRLAHRRSAADYKQIAGLSILHLIATTVITRDLSYAALFGAYVVVTPWMLGLTQVREALERQYRDPAKGEHELDARLAEVLSRRGWVGPGFFVGTAALSLSLVAVTVTLFLAFPRVSGDFIGLRGGAGETVTGFGRDVALGGFGTIRTDRRVVVRLMSEEAPAEGETLLPLVLRGTSFDRYEHGRWTRSDSPSERVSLSRRPLWLTTERAEPARDRVTIVSELTQEPVLLVPEGSMRIERATAGTGALVDEVEHRPGVDVRAVDDERSVRRYAVALARSPRPHEPGNLDRYLALPPQMGRVAALAREVVGDETRPLEMARAIERHLRSGAYTYTLDQVSVDGIDPIEHFLFERRAGHCEYFSTAMALMLRALGVPSRNVTGFVGGRFNEYGGYYAIQQGDAHSWVEAFAEGEFVRFDPTPPARETFGIEDGLFTNVQAFLDSLRMRWYEDVVGYGWEDQRRLFASLRAWARSSSVPAAELPADRRDDLDLSALRSPWIPLALALAAALGALGWRASRRRPAEEPEEVRLLRSIEARAARLGAKKPESTTPLEWAGRLEAERSPLAAAVGRGVRAYAALRYEGATDRGTHLDQMREALDSLARARAQGANWRK
jgi:protein-glutamine gamma-glutamyltransferase